MARNAAEKRTAKVKCLRPFKLADGKIAEKGKTYELELSDARLAASANKCELVESAEGRAGTENASGRGARAAS